MNSLKILFLFLLFSGLMSCAVDTTKKDEQTLAPKLELIDIDEDVEEDFDTALTHLKAAEYDEAIKLLKKVIAQEDRLPAPFVNLGMAYNAIGDVKNAEKYFLAALNVKLTHRVANNQLGLLYRKKGQFEDAKKAYTNALTEYPDYLPVIKNLGILCEIYMRDLTCALQQYEHYLDLQPDDKTMKIWVADLSRRIK